MMRKAGIIAGANPPEPVEEDPQRETNATVILVERPPTPELLDENGVVIVKKKKKKKKVRLKTEQILRAAATDILSSLVTRTHSSFPSPLFVQNQGVRRQFFTVDLKRFRNVEVMKGDGIGEKGGTALGRELVAGVCPRLHKIDLGWNSLKFKGTQTLMDAFARGCASGVTWLDLRANHIDERGIQGFKVAMEKGALPNLVHLNLSQNSFGDAGAKIIAHMVLGELLQTIENIRLDSCQVRDLGLSALFKAFNAKSIFSLMPNLKLVSVKNNHPSTAIVKQFGIIPSHFMI